MFCPILFVSSHLACPMGKISLATGERCEWKSGPFCYEKENMERDRNYLLLCPVSILTELIFRILFVNIF